MSAEVTKTSPAAVLQPTEQMWREMLPQLRTFVRRRIADPNRADDLVADILLRIHQNVGSLDDQERLPNWVFRIARNAIIDEYRRAGRSKEQLVETLQDEPAPASADEEPGAVQELSACLRPMLAGLPEEQRAAVEMIDLDGLSQADAAERAGVSLSGMKSRVQRGRRKLAELLGQCCTMTLDGRGVPMDYEPPPGCGCAGADPQPGSASH
jgi:RNA polymerase sigma-70 factor, ECF subfamily